MGRGQRKGEAWKGKGIAHKGGHQGKGKPGKGVASRSRGSAWWDSRSGVEPGLSSGTGDEHLLRSSGSGVESSSGVGAASQSLRASGSGVDSPQAFADALRIGPSGDDKAETDANAWGGGAMEAVAVAGESPWSTWESVETGMLAEGAYGDHPRSHSSPAPCWRGAFYQAPGYRSKIRLRAYEWPFDFNPGGKVLAELEPTEYFGPVHRWYDCPKFRSVLVPFLRTVNGAKKTHLVWVNVYDFQTRTALAKIIHKPSGSRLCAMGWERPQWAPAEFEISRTPSALLRPALQVAVAASAASSGGPPQEGDKEGDEV